MNVTFEFLHSLTFINVPKRHCHVGAARVYQCSVRGELHVQNGTRMAGENAQVFAFAIHAPYDCKRRGSILEQERSDVQYLLTDFSVVSRRCQVVSFGMELRGEYVSFVALQRHDRHEETGRPRVDLRGKIQ